MAIVVNVFGGILGLGNFYNKGHNMMPSIDMGATHSTHKFKLCTKCDTAKPPEGGIEMGAKWICQACWNKRITGKNLQQNRKSRNA